MPKQKQAKSWARKNRSRFVRFPAQFLFPLAQSSLQAPASSLLCSGSSLLLQSSPATPAQDSPAPPAPAALHLPQPCFPSFSRRLPGAPPSATTQPWQGLFANCSRLNKPLKTWELICVSLLSRVSEQSELHQVAPFGVATNVERSPEINYGEIFLLMPFHHALPEL